MDSPLPLRDGIAASYLWLPEGAAGRLLDFLCQRFTDVSLATWQARLLKNEVCDQHGTPLHADSPARRGMCIFYYRETEQETPIPFQAQILHQDQHLLVVDKPHFLPVTPGGRFLHETLLVRLKKQTGLPHLSPIHRLDRETAGVILFSLNPASRGAYQELFARRQISKTYLALAPALPATLFPLVHRSHMSEGSHFFTMQESPGLANSETRIDIAEQRGALNLYNLQPLTGKKHQLRVHMASLGAPIVNDSFYPVALPCKGDDFNTPLQLLASSIAFIDPHSGQARQFHSQRSLAAADERTSY
ncbi:MULTISPECIES: pseudouridine synthase [unclassified Undibacterium]|uniref:pseudouridine synthase n=1 Tax=unclassified Undibacterium TaxID=2630295 RepID=UPI002AC90953|nr:MULTISPECIES: pseudouridine synthase [unclassified Undibacterium]MEB0141025.1 pseudouridine synthase [Undibacterium sp. CCC2.1]MEB0174019.1 pseudouridine synthase [Undibacterium sp. CCC1.1]MEB0177975.1 pseudouridine synthase [Undibacterium sp. CCC3.4]MEB0217201.1 pseudouridine synthase [Undibacterium sp. 5I2]WPX42177.1 pseudouridine synthase [Undibacterium sp. CCC3.4]